MILPPKTTATPTRIGVGLDTARYGHVATFLRDDRQQAAKPLEFLESRGGYRSFRDILERLAQKYPDVHFQIRVDAAGQYAANLLHFLQQLPWSKTISVGQPAQNKEYRKVHYPKRKADVTDSLSCARYAIVEQPASSTMVPAKLRDLQEVVSRLEFQIKMSTRQVNRLHNLLARTFPELATIQRDLSTGWLLQILDKYPTAERLAKARLGSLVAIPYVTAAKAQRLQEAAATSVACETGAIVEKLMRQSVRELRQSLKTEERLRTLAKVAFHQLPDVRAKQIATIKGIGEVTAAVLVAKIVTIDRFPTADHLVSYFGTFPEEVSSGVDRHGRSLPAGTRRMSRQGNDLVRRYLWMAAFSGIRHNPHLKDLYRRLRGRGRRGDVALGHCMRKLLHQVFGIWTSGKPYDPNYHRGETTVAPLASPETGSAEKKAAGRKAGSTPLRKAVTATTSTLTHAMPTVKRATPPTDVNGFASLATATLCANIDLPHLRSQISMARVLQHLGYFDRLRGCEQRRGPCPVHGSKRDRGRHFSVHLGKNVFRCFHPPCGAAGDVLDLWCAVHELTPEEGARHLAQTFDLPLRFVGENEP